MKRLKVIIMLVLILAACARQDQSPQAGDWIMFKAGMNHQPCATGCVLWLGDSNSFYMNLPACNAGVPGIRVEGVISLIDSYLEYDPVRIFVMIGTNNKYDPDFRAQYEAMMLKLLAEGAPLYCISILPVWDDADNQWYEQANLQIQDLCSIHGATYIQTTGIEDEDLCDGVHLNHTGQKKFIDQITPYL